MIEGKDKQKGKGKQKARKDNEKGPCILEEKEGQGLSETNI